MIVLGEDFLFQVNISCDAMISVGPFVVFTTAAKNLAETVSR